MSTIGRMRDIWGREIPTIGLMRGILIRWSHAETLGRGGGGRVGRERMDQIPTIALMRDIWEREIPTIGLIRGICSFARPRGTRLSHPFCRFASSGANSAS